MLKMTSEDELENCIDQTASLRFAESYSDIRSTLSEGGYFSNQLVLYSIDHAGDADAQLRLVSKDGRNMEIIIRAVANKSVYDTIVSHRDLEYGDSTEDAALLDIINSEESFASFGEKVRDYIA